MVGTECGEKLVLYNSASINPDCGADGICIEGWVGFDGFAGFWEIYAYTGLVSSSSFLSYKTFNQSALPCQDLPTTLVSTDRMRNVTKYSTYSALVRPSPWPPPRRRRLFGFHGPRSASLDDW